MQPLCHDDCSNIPVQSYSKHRAINPSRTHHCVAQGSDLEFKNIISPLPQNCPHTTARAGAKCRNLNSPLRCGNSPTLAKQTTHQICPNALNSQLYTTGGDKLMSCTQKQHQNQLEKGHTLLFCAHALSRFRQREKKTKGEHQRKSYFKAETAHARLRESVL